MVIKFQNGGHLKWFLSSYFHHGATWAVIVSFCAIDNLYINDKVEVNKRADIQKTWWEIHVLSCQCKYCMLNIKITFINIYAEFLNIWFVCSRLEIREIRGSSFIQGIMLSFIIFHNRLAIFCSIVSYVLYGNIINASIVSISYYLYSYIIVVLHLFIMMCCLKERIFVLKKLSTVKTIFCNNITIIGGFSDDEPLVIGNMFTEMYIKELK